MLGAVYCSNSLACTGFAADIDRSAEITESILFLRRVQKQPPWLYFTVYCLSEFFNGIIVIYYKYAIAYGIFYDGLAFAFRCQPLTYFTVCEPSLTHLDYCRLITGKRCPYQLI